MRVLITGASGFVGCGLVKLMASRGDEVLAGLRRPDAALKKIWNVNTVEMGDLQGGSWGSELAGVDAVVHLAARVHVMSDTAADPLEAFRKVNVEGTRRLAAAAAVAGVSRFVYVSSIKVNGDSTVSRPFRPDDTPSPTDPYSVSKLEAEHVVAEICSVSPMSFAIVRPPLVYGPGVRGNFLRLMRWIEKGIPLPLAAVDNRRSMVSLGNLVDLLALCVSHPAAADQVFLVSDGKDWSTPALIREVAHLLGGPARLFAVPPWLLRRMGEILGMGAAIERLSGSLQVDDTATRTELGWQPPESSTDALRETVEALVAERRRG
jgi:nucleoside-diphosphate-sugar epimerase